MGDHCAESGPTNETIKLVKRDGIDTMLATIRSFVELDQTRSG
jgi:hypothetical protein